MKNKEKTEIKVSYHYVEPKTKQEAQEAERRLQTAFDILFEATPASKKSKQYKASKRKP